jgi:hypothetical protein
VGYTFPGVDQIKIDAALTSKKAVKELFLEPKMDIGPITPTGVILIDFN